MRTEAAKRHLIDFACYTFARYTPAPHHSEIARRLEAVAAGQCKRLIVTMPPRHGKSELVSVRFPAWFLGSHVDKRIIHASYAASLSNAFSRQVRNLIRSDAYRAIFPGVSLAEDSQAVDSWDLQGSRGGFVSVGVGGGVTGKGAHLLLIDDYVKSADEADSQTYRDRAWEWYTHDAYTRLEDGGAIVVVATRWHEDDLIGRLLEAQKAGGDTWDVLHLPAISDDGSALWPAKYPLTELEQIRAAIGGRAWEALYQGRPVPPGGAIFRRDWLKYVERQERGFIKQTVQAWDTAYKEGQASDYSACVTLGVDATNRIVVLDVWRGRVEFPDLIARMQSMAELWRPAVVIVEDQASGTSAVQALQRTTHLPLVTVRPERDKQARAKAITPHLEAGKVYITQGASWQDAFETELLSFPTGQHDDQVDAFVYALERVTQPTARARVR